MQKFGNCHPVYPRGLKDIRLQRFIAAQFIAAGTDSYELIRNGQGKTMIMAQTIIFFAGLAKETGEDFQVKVVTCGSHLVQQLKEDFKRAISRDLDGFYEVINIESGFIGPCDLLLVDEADECLRLGLIQFDAQHSLTCFTDIRNCKRVHMFSATDEAAFVKTAAVLGVETVRVHRTMF